MTMTAIKTIRELKDPLELEVVESHLGWVLGIEQGSHGRATSAVNKSIIFPSHQDFLVLGVFV